MEACQIEKLNLKILIVETSEHLRRMLSAMVRPIKGELFLASNAEDGFRLARAVKPELIIADHGLNGSGAALCRRVREDAELGKTPLVMLSAFGAHLSLSQYRNTGCDQVVYKPFQCMDLFVAIKAAMAREEAGEDRIIPVMYRSGKCDLIEAKALDELIRAGEIDCFRRRNGLVVIGRDPVRSDDDTGYNGTDRRSSSG